MTQPNETSAVFTDPNLNNYQDLVNRVAALEEALLNHTGDTLGSSGAFAPHPIQIIDTAEFGGGAMRLDADGIKLHASTSRALIYFLSDLSQLVGTFPNGVISGRSGINAGNATGVVTVAAAADNTHAASLAVTSAPNVQSNAGLQAVYGTEIVNIEAIADGVEPTILLQGAPVYLPVYAGDPSTVLADGMIWYDSTNNRFRVRAAGATRTVTIA